MSTPTSEASPLADTTMPWRASIAALAPTAGRPKDTARVAHTKALRRKEPRDGTFIGLLLAGGERDDKAGQSRHLHARAYLSGRIPGTTFRPEDLARGGIAKGEDFELEAGGKTFLVRYGSDYGDVPRGAWIAFDRAEGVLLIARNYASAAETASVSAGDPLTLRPKPEN